MRTQMTFFLSTEMWTQIKKGKTSATTLRGSGSGVGSVTRWPEGSPSSPSCCPQSRYGACAVAVLVSLKYGSEGNGPRKSCSNQSPCDPSEVVNHLSSVGGGSTSTGSGFPGETESPEVEPPEHHGDGVTSDREWDRSPGDTGGVMSPSSSYCNMLVVAVLEWLCDVLRRYDFRYRRWWNHHKGRGCSDVEEASVCQLPSVPLDHGLTLSSRYTSRSFPCSRSSLSPALRSFGCFRRPTPPDLVPAFGRPYGYSVSDCNRVGVQTDTPTPSPSSHSSLSSTLRFLGFCILKFHLFVLHNTDTISFPLFRCRFLRYNKHIVWLVS